MQSQGLSATVKHFMGNNQEYDRHNMDSIIDERTMREISAVNALGEATTSFSVDVNTKAVPAANDLITAVGKIPNVITTTTTSFDAAGKTVTTVTTGFNSFGQQVTQTSKVLQDGVSDIDQFGVGLTNTAGQMAEASVKALALKSGIVDVNTASTTFITSEGQVVTIAGQVTDGVQAMAGAFTNLFAAMGKGAAAQAQYALTGSTGVATTQAVDAAIQHLTASVTASANATTVNQAVHRLQAQLANLVPGTADYATQLQLIAAQTKAMGTATDTASTSGKGFKDTIDGVTQAMEQAQEKAQSSISVFQNLATAHSGDADAVGLLAASYTKAESAAKAAGQAFADAAGEAAKQKVSFDQASASTQAMQDALGGLIIQYYAAVAATIQVDSATDFALSYKAVEAEVAKTGGTYENATAQLIALNVAGNNAQSALTGQAAVWTELASATNKTADQQAQMAAVFKTVQTDAAAVGLTVTQVGNSLIYAAAPGIKMDAAVQGLLTTLNAAAIASGNFVTIGGKLVPTLSALADAASGANAGIGGMNATINAAGVIISGLGTAATTAAPKVASIGTAAQQAGPQIIDLTTNMDGAYRSSFIGGPAMVTYANAIKGVGTAAQGAGPQIINLNKNMDGIYETVFTGAPVVTQFGSALTSAGSSARGAATQVGSFVTAAGGIPAIINGVRFDNWENGFFQTGASAQTAAGQIMSAGTATQATSDAFGTLPVRASLVSSAFTDLTTGIKTFDVAGRDADGTYGQMTIQVTGAMDAIDLIGRGATDAAVYVNQLTTAGHNIDGTFSDVTVTVTGTTDQVDIMGSAAQIAATHVQTMGQYATTCGDECGDLPMRENFTNAAPGAVSASDNIASGFDTISSAAQSAASAVGSLGSKLDAFDAQMGDSSWSRDAAQSFAMATMQNPGLSGFVSNIPMPGVNDPNSAAEQGMLNFLTMDGGVDLNAPRTVQNAQQQYSLESQGFTDVTIAQQANTTATTANTTATTANSTAASSNSTALGTGTTAVTAYTGSINLATGAYTAGTQAVTNFGNAVPLGTAAVNQFIEGIQTYKPVIAGVTDTTTLASQAIIANAAAFAQSTGATSESTAAQIEAMYEAEGFSQQMAIAGADAVLGIQNTTTAMVPLSYAVGSLTTASNTLSDSLTGSSGLQPAVDSTTASFASSVSASDSLTKGLGDATTAFVGSSGLNKAVTSIDTAISGPSGLTGALGNLTDAAGQAAGALNALKSVGTSDAGLEHITSQTTQTYNNVPTSPMPTSPPSGASGAGNWVWDFVKQAWVWEALAAGGTTASPAAPNLPTGLSTSLTPANFLPPTGGLTQDQQDLLTEQAALAQQMADQNNASVSAAQVQQDYSNVQTAAAKVQQNYADAQANAANAQNAYTNAIDAATDPQTGIVAMTPQIQALGLAAQAAAQILQGLTGGGTIAQSHAAPQTSLTTSLTAADFLPGGRRAHAGANR